MCVYVNDKVYKSKPKTLRLVLFRYVNRVKLK